MNIALPSSAVSKGRREKKQRLLASLIAQVEGEIATMRKAAYDAAEAATHAEAKPENDKDTRALEASYLAAGQAERVRELESALKLLVGLELRDIGKTTPICASAVITLEDVTARATTTFFMSPHGGGVRLDLDGASVQVVTPQSPLGKALLGRTHGDSFELRGKAGLREMTIVDVW
jgi:transcription elongation GreA/GreB family factor